MSRAKTGMGTQASCLHVRRRAHSRIHRAKPDSEMERSEIELARLPLGTLGCKVNSAEGGREGTLGCMSRAKPKCCGT